jgi:ribosomal protein S18 acetylase RimI-like enzyme
VTSVPDRPAVDASDPVVYREPGRRYTSSLILFLLLLAGFVLDLILGGGTFHLIAWPIAFVVVVGIDALAVHAARVVRPLTITSTTVLAGEQSLLRRHIVTVVPTPEGTPQILGRALGEGLPPGKRGLPVLLADGATVLIPTRHPDRVTRALQLEATTDVTIRPAALADLPLLAEVDERAEALFHVSGLGLPQIPFVVDELHDAKAVFVAGRPPVGFVQVDEVDGLAHIEELAVVPGSMRQGLGGKLIEAACEWARQHGYPAITLITFAEVPWNGPFYAARGFVELSELAPEILELRDWERDVGLDAVGRRIVMRREL